MKENTYNYKNQTGLYRNRITIFRRSIRVDALNQQIQTYEEFGKFWAMIKSYKSNEYIGSGEEQTKKEKRFVIKYAKSLDVFVASDSNSYEIHFKNEIFDVISTINDNDLNESITITAVVRV